MKIIRNLAVGIFALIGLVSNPVIADDNEVLIDQEGENLVLTIFHLYHHTGIHLLQLDG